MSAYGSFEQWMGRKQFYGLRHRRRFYERMYRFTSRGFSHTDALVGMRDRMVRKKDPRRFVYMGFMDGLREGTIFSALIGRHIPSAELLMLSAGEETGKADEGFRLAGYVAAAVARMRGAVTSALAYPGLLLIMLCGLLAMVVLKIMPIMETIAPLSQWPPVAHGLHTLAAFVVNDGWWVALLLAAGIVVALRRLPTWTGRVRSVLDRVLPPWTIYRIYQGASFLISLSSLVGSGTSLEGALRSINRSAAPWLRAHLLKMIVRAREGAEPAKVLDTHLLHEETLGDIEDYSRAAAFEGTVAAIGEHAVEDSIERIQSAAAVLRTLLILLVAGMIVWVYAAMLFLTMSISQNQQNMGH